MSAYMGFTFEADEVVGLPLDELALHVLNDYVVTNEKLGEVEPAVAKDV